jgi:ribosomal-protein-alanine N-acetyltransferase
MVVIKVEKEESLKAPLLETERLILRGLTSEDMDFLFRHFSQDEINLYSSSDNLKSMEETKEFYAKYIPPSPTRFRLGIVLKETNELIGTLGFHRFSKRDSCAEAGADLMRSHWGKGLMTEALKSLLEFGFNDMNLNRIEATANLKNARSIRLMERIGFQKEGVLRKKYFYKGQYHDDVVYSLLKEEWK